MEAGRELDALVAEKVMGWKDVNTAWPSYGSPPESPDGWREIPAFSTDIAAAWEVVEKLSGPNVVDDFRLAYWGGCWRAEFQSMIFQYCEAPTAPQAICLAALRVLGLFGISDTPRQPGKLGTP